MLTPHKHAETIKAWADGHEIQFHIGDGKWRDTGGTPCWYDWFVYRAKPKKLTAVELYCKKMGYNPVRFDEEYRQRMEIGLTAIVQACKNGELAE
jgi:hypothetical protein